MLQKIMHQRRISCYSLAKHCNLPYSTINDIYNNKTPLNKCRAEIVYKISQVLGISMESLLSPLMHERIDFDLFKSNVCHRVKSLGDVSFIRKSLENDTIREYFNRNWYPESLYLLAMTDYLSRINNIPLCNRYDDLRHQKLKQTVFPASILALAAVSPNHNIKEDAIKESIPEFIRFNIVENEVKNIV